MTELLFYDSVAFVEKVIHLTMQRLADQIQGMTAEISFQTGDSILKYRTGMPVSKALSVHVMPREEYADCTR
ncbi:MAG TPA: hypothetical protein VN429_11225 [Methanospirillum sp.]|uniref:hypothetical protein n=1 Tax=Methanospirillum sp. TaxID=45200 RepID=UPI002C05B8C7|nr:hypothetical protein [Methanospirillum sp.]HWQ64979.1 hypothetical protein [Methanospirillum sp.]